MKYCTHCGRQVDDECVICPGCGCYADRSKTSKAVQPGTSPKSRVIDALLCFFIGCLGVHCFYEGKIGKGILYVFTCGLLGIGALVDFILIVCGAGTDKQGLKILNWDIE